MDREDVRDVMELRALPTTKKEMLQRGWEQADVILFSADAYVDHPSFGAAVIGRLLEDEGYRVCIVPSPTGTAITGTSGNWGVRVSFFPSRRAVWIRW